MKQKLYSILVLFFGLVLLEGCAIKPPAKQSALEASAARQITCLKGDDCDTKWELAVAWVSNNSAWKIQTQTNNLVQTFGPSTRNSLASAYTVNKIPLDNGKYEITFKSGCANFMGCIPKANELKAKFNSYVLRDNI